MGIIQKEKFSQLKQLDRIEYILKRNRIVEEHSSSYLLGFVKAFLFSFSFLILLMILFIQVGGIQYFRLFSYGIVFLYKAFILLIILGFVADVFDIVRYRKDMEELNSEYFNFKIELKNGKDNKWQRKR